MKDWQFWSILFALWLITVAVREQARYSREMLETVRARNVFIHAGP